MKARGWYKGKGSHKKEVSARIVHVVRGPWGARIAIWSAEHASRECFELTLTPAESDDLAARLGGAKARSRVSTDDEPQQCDTCGLNPDVCMCDGASTPPGPGTPPQGGTR
jgi:hypothetical protein